MYLAITWNKKEDWGHVTRLIPNPNHPAGNGCDTVRKIKKGNEGYRSGLYSTKKSILSATEAID